MRQLELFLAKFFGAKYVANWNTKELHNLNTQHDNCWLHLMSNCTYIFREKRARALLEHGFNGCRWCFKEEDTD